MSTNANNILKYTILGGLFAVLFIPFYVPSAFFFPFVTGKAFAFRIIVEIIFALWVILAIRNKEYRPKFSWIFGAFIIFMVILGLADIFGENPLKSFWSNFERMEGYIAFIHFFVYFVVASSVLNTKKLWQKFWNTSIFASVIMIFYSMVQLSGAIPISQGGARVDGTLGNAAYLALYMLFNFFITFYYWKKEEKGSIFRYVYPIVMLGQFWILYETATRGAIIGLIIGVLTMLVINLFSGKEYSKLKKTSIISLIAIFVLIGGFVALRNSSFVKDSRTLSRFSTMSISEIKTQGRYYVWPMAIQGIKERPLLGWGQDNFNYVFSEHYNPAMYAQEPWFDRTHDIILDWGITGGLLGLASYLSLFVFLLYYIWRKREEKDSTFDFYDRSILTGLIFAYFFNNIFIFDNISSYIFFFAILAFVHTFSSKEIKFIEKISDKDTYVQIGAVIVIPIVAFTLYYWNVKPIYANMTLIDGFSHLQSENQSEKVLYLDSFKSAINGSRLGRPEEREQLVSIVETVLKSPLLTVEQKNEYFVFTKNQIETQAKEFPNDARYQILAGLFLSKTGHSDEAMVYLQKAKELSPKKQAIYFEIGSIYIAKKEYAKAEDTFKYAYELDKNYGDAKSIYILGAIYNKDTATEKELISSTPKDGLVNDDRILEAYTNTARYNDAINLLLRRKELSPDNYETYVSLAALYLKIGQKEKAIESLGDLTKVAPQYKSQADDYIQKIREGKSLQ